MTITPDDEKDDTPERATSWWSALIDLLRPAFYGRPWVPWLRITISAAVVLAVYLMLMR